MSEDDATDVFCGLYLGAVSCMGGNRTHEKSGGVSVLIPCYGKSLYVKEAVESCLNQTMKAEKIIVLLMDDDSIAMKDELESLDDTVKCIVHERMNVCKARNYLVDKCETEHFIFLDADDLLFHEFIDTVWKEKANVVFTNLKHKIDDEYYADNQIRDYGAYNALKQNPTALWSKTVFTDIGKFDEYFSVGCEDTDLIIRLLKSEWKCTYIDKFLFAYRLYAENSLTEKTEFKEMKLKLFNKHKEWFVKQLKRNNFYSYPGWLTDCSLDEVTKSDCKKILFDAKVCIPQPKHRCTFVFDKRCNVNCEYCYQLSDEDRNLVLSDDEWFDRFDKALKKAEEVYSDGIRVQIMGGEPSLWNDSLVERIIERLYDYDSFTLFSNGINRKSKWFTSQKTMMSWHIVDWDTQGKIDGYYKNISDKNVIVVEPRNIDKLDEFLTENDDVMFMVAGSGCAGSGAEETRCSFDDMKKIAEICNRHENTYDDIPQFVDIVESNGLEDAQRRCREFGSVTTFNLGTMLVSPCNKADVVKVPMDEWCYPEYKCENCMWFCGGM